MTKPLREKLALDIDETIVHFLEGFLSWRNPLKGSSFKPSDFKSYRWWETLGGTKEEAYAEAHEFTRYVLSHYDGGQITSPIPLDERALSCLELLARRYEFFGITDRLVGMERDTYELSSLLYFEDIENRGFDGLVLPFDKIHSTRDELGNRVKTKAQICRDLGIELLVDDNPEIAEECVPHGISVLMVDRPWNRGYSNPSVFKGSWYEVSRELLKRKK